MHEKMKNHKSNGSLIGGQKHETGYIQNKNGNTSLPKPSFVLTDSLTKINNIRMMSETYTTKKQKFLLGDTLKITICLKGFWRT